MIKTYHLNYNNIPGEFYAIICHNCVRLFKVAPFNFNENALKDFLKM